MTSRSSERKSVKPESDGGFRFLSRRQLCDLQGLPELTGTIRMPVGGTSQREFACIKVTLGDSDYNVMADAITGQIYRDGRCLSGPLILASKVKETGRTIKALQRRLDAASTRSAASVVYTRTDAE